MERKKLREIVDVIDKDIAEREKVAQDALLTLEKLNVTAAEYKKANQKFSINHFIAAYLKHIRSAADKCDLKSIENLMRYHAYCQRTKGALDDGSELSVGQVAVAVTLEGYVRKFFEA